MASSKQYSFPFGEQLQINFIDDEYLTDHVLAATLHLADLIGQSSDNTSITITHQGIVTTFTKDGTTQESHNAS